MIRNRLPKLASRFRLLAATLLVAGQLGSPLLSHVVAGAASATLVGVVAPSDALAQVSINPTRDKRLLRSRIRSGNEGLQIKSRADAEKQASDVVGQGFDTADTILALLRDFIYILMVGGAIWGVIKLATGQGQDKGFILRIAGGVLIAAMAGTGLGFLAGSVTPGTGWLLP